MSSRPVRPVVRPSLAAARRGEPTAAPTPSRPPRPAPPAQAPCCRSSAASCRCRSLGGGEARYANLDYGATAPALTRGRRARHARAAVRTARSTAGQACRRASARRSTSRRARRSPPPSVPPPSTRSSSPATPPTRPTCSPTRSRRAPARSSSSTASTTPTCCRGAAASHRRRRRADAGRDARAAARPRSPRSRPRCWRSPAPPTSPASCCRWRSWWRSRTTTARGSRSTPRSWRRTCGSTSPRSAPTTSRSPGTSCTRPTAPARSSAAATGSTAAQPWLAGGGAVRDVSVDGTAVGRRPRPPRGRHAEPARRGRDRRGLHAARRARRPAPWRPTTARCASGCSARLTRLAGVHAAADLGRQRRGDRHRLLHRRRPRAGSRRGLPLGRARDRRPRRPLLRPPAADPPRPPRRCAARLLRRRHPGRRRRAPRRRARPPRPRGPPRRAYASGPDGWAPVGDERELPELLSTLQHQRRHDGRREGVGRLLDRGVGGSRSQVAGRRILRGAEQDRAEQLGGSASAGGGRARAGGGLRSGERRRRGR